MISRLLNGRMWWVSLLAGSVCVVLTYLTTVQALVNQWMNNQDYSHGLLVIPVAAYLAWLKRDELRATTVRSDWRGLLLLGLGLFLHAAGELGAELFTIRLSMLLCFVGLIWVVFGLQVIRLLTFPLAFLFVMLPLPGFVYRTITFPLQLFSSEWSVNLLHAMGLTAFREGNVIDLDFMVLQVVEACSGLRFILPLFASGLLFAYMGEKAYWKRVVLVLATIPISILANILRIAGTGVIGMTWGTEAAEGFFHSFSGWLVFMFSVGVFFFLDFLLKLLPGKPEVGGRRSEVGGRRLEVGRHKEEESKEQRAESSPPNPEALGRRDVRVWAVVAALAVILVNPLVVTSFGNVPHVPLIKPLAEFPLDFKGYAGKKSQMDAKMWDQVGGQDYVIVDYQKAGFSPIQFYVAYYESQRKAGDFIHSPRLCIPGGGWFIEENRVRHLEAGADGSGAPLNLNELVISKDGVRQLVYFWYQGRGRNFTGEYAAKFYMVWDGLFRRRTDGALVRLTTPLAEGMTVDAARRTLDPFAQAAFQELDRFLP